MAFYIFAPIYFMLGRGFDKESFFEASLVVLEEKLRVGVQKFTILIGRLLQKYLLLKYPISTLHKSCNFKIPSFFKILS